MKKMFVLSLTGLVVLGSLTGCVKIDETEETAAETAAAEEAAAADSEGASEGSAEEAAPAEEASKEGSRPGELCTTGGEYLDPEVLDMFEEETGIEVVYEEFETNEIMYPKVATGAIAYDVICPSDYMIQRMIQEDLLQEINFDNVPNIKNIDEEYMKWSEEFDPGNKYSVPYCWGTVGILYNKEMVEEPIDSWEVLWDEQYENTSSCRTA